MKILTKVPLSCKNGRFTLWQHRSRTRNSSICVVTDLNSTIQRRFSSSIWTANELIRLDAQINSFGNRSANVFGRHQSSNIRTTK